MGQIQNLELEFYFKLFKRHIEELFMLIKEKNMKRRYLKNDNRWYLKNSFFPF